MTIVAPYSYSWSKGNVSSYAIPDLATATSKLGLKEATWAFLVGNGSGGVCYDYTNDLADLQAFSAIPGNKLIISLGGASGPYLEPSVNQDTLVSILEKVLTDTKAYGFDFDVEGAAIADTATIDKRNKAIAALQKNHPGLYISYTLATQNPAWGSLTADAIALLKNAVSNGVEVTVVNGMIMDLYSSALFTPPATYGSIAISILESMKSQLAAIWPSKNDSQLYAMLGATPMIGRGDDSQVFQIPDAQTLTDYIVKNQLGLLSYWSLQRDQSSMSGGLATSSMVPQANYAFYNVFKAAMSSSSSSSGSTSTTTPTPPPPPPPPPPVTSDPPPPYSSGPPTNPPPTTSNPPPTTTVTPPSSSTTPTVVNGDVWPPGISYEKGNIVVWNGESYECLQPHISQSDWEPNVAASLWQDLGKATTTTPTTPPSTTPATPPSTTPTTPPSTIPPSTTPPTPPAGGSLNLTSSQVNDLQQHLQAAIASLTAVLATLTPVSNS